MQSASSKLTLAPTKARPNAALRVLLNIGIAVGGVVLARLLASVTQIVLARLMGVADYGMYTTLYALLGPVIMLTSFGLDTWLLRQAGDAAVLATAINTVFWFRLLATSGLMVLGVGAILWSGYVTLAVPLTLAAIGLTCEQLLTTAYSGLRAQIRNTAAAVLQVLVAALTLLLIWLFWNTRYPLLGMTAYRLLAAGLGLGVMGVLMRHTIHRVSWKPHAFRAMLQQARVYFAADALSAVALKADLILVALLIGALGAGIYNPALTIINTTFLVPAVIYQVLLPILSGPQIGARTFRNLVALAVAASTLYGLICGGILLWSSDLIIEILFDPEYRATVPLLQIMSAIPLLKSINFCWAVVMIVRDRQVLRTQLLAVGALVNVAANLVAIPLFGLAGAAWVNVVTEVILLGCYSYGAWVSVSRKP
jgi:O-antigen/teichoic acid export membrane protein